MRVIAGYALGRATWDDPNPNGGHGTHTSGSIVGNGIRSGSTPNTNTFPSTCFAGNAPKAQFVFQSIMDGSGNLGGLPADLNTLFQQTYNDGARVHSNSWGAPVAGQYTADSQDVDQFTWANKDMVITFSAGNSGVDGRASGMFGCSNNGDPIDGVIDDDSIGAPGTAKNCITVGATENYRPTYVYEYPQGDCTGTATVQTSWGWFNGCSFSVNPINTDLLADNANGMGAFSSRGPTDDLRFKPDVSAPGIAIVSTRTNQNQQYEQWGICPVPVAQRPYYLSQGGTSMANPLTAGAAVLVRQYYADGWHANNSAVTNGSAVGGDAFSPSSALVKATLINGAWDMRPGQYGGGGTTELPPGWDSPNNLPNNAMGYGRVDVESSLFPGSGFGHDAAREMAVHDVSTGLMTGQVNSHDVTIASNGDPLIITLVWTDPYAATGGGTKLVNNLDLEVFAPGGTRYYPNRVNYTGGSTDTRNNVEQVYVTSPTPGTWSIDVRGTSVPGNAVPGSNAQPYALVISGVLGSPCTAPSAPTGLNATASAPNTIALTWNAVASDSYNVYRSTTMGGPYGLLASGLVTNSYNDTTVSDGTTYYYVVTALNNPNCESAISNEDSAIAFGDCTSDPTFAGLQSVTPFPNGGACGLKLTWNEATANCGTGVVYNIYRSTTMGGPYSLIAGCVTDLFYDDTAITGGVTYYYLVRAEDNTNGNGGPCNSGNEDTNTNEMSGVFLVASTITVFQDTFDAAPFPADLMNFGFSFGNPYTTGGCAGATMADDWYEPETGFCSGNAMASNDGAGNPGYSDPNNGAAILGNPPSGGPPFTDGGIVLPAGATSITLTFDHDYDFESTNWDGGRVMICDNNWPTFTAITPVGGYPGFTRNTTTYCHPWPNQPAYIADSGGCVSAEFDLTAYAGQRVWIAWNHGADNFSTGDDGWIIDNILIEANVAGACNAAPNPVSFFTATSTSTQNVLEWQNPLGAYGSTMIRFSTAGFPASPSDGTLLVDQNDGMGMKGTTVHSSLTNDTTVYYTAFVNDGSGNFSAARTVSGRPQLTSGALAWIYNTGATAMAPPGIGSVYGVSNDRNFHSMATGGAGAGQWPATWTPMAMNAPAQSRPPIVPLAIAGQKTAFLGSLDGYAYAVNADTGAQIWASSAQLGDMVIAAPAGIFAAFGATVDLVMVGTRNLTNPNVFYGLNAATGMVAWSFDNGGGASALGIMSGTPTVNYSSNRVYFTSRARSGGSNHTVWCLSVTQGSAALLWSAPIGDVDTSPVLVGNRLYVTNLGGQVHALNADTGAPEWPIPFNTGDGAVKIAVSPDFTAPDLIFSTNSTVWSIDATGMTPTINWTVNTIPNPSAPLVNLSGNHVWVGSGNGNLYQLDKDTGGGILSLQIGDGSAAVGSPAFSNGDNLIFVGTESGAVHAIAIPLGP